MFVRENAKVTLIKKKIFDFMKTKKMDLNTIFELLDKDKSKGITIGEFSKGLDKIITAEECRILFELVDADKSGEVSYDELINEC